MCPGRQLINYNMILLRSVYDVMSQIRCARCKLQLFTIVSPSNPCAPSLNEFYLSLDFYANLLYGSSDLKINTNKSYSFF